MHKPLCVSMCMCPHALGGVAHGTKLIPVDRNFGNRSPWTETGKGGSEGMMRVDGGCRWGPAGMEQPANEEPSEASIHLEHGPLQLPRPWL